MDKEFEGMENDEDCFYRWDFARGIFLERGL